jgi:hypothetical protein
LLKTSIFLDTAVSYMPDLLDQLQLLAECGYLSDMWAAPYINEQVKQEQVALSPENFSGASWREAVCRLLYFSLGALPELFSD